MDNQEVSPSVQRQAELLQRTADWLSDTRGDGGITLGVVAAIEGPSVPLAAAAGVLAIFDKVDGWMAKKAASLLDQPTTHEGSERDHRADKRYYYGLMGGLALYELRKGNTLKSAFYVGNMAVVGWRDYKMAQVREEAHAHGKDTKAPLINKYKTVLQMGGITLASGLAKHIPGGNKSARTTIAAGTAMAVGTYQRFRYRHQHNLLPDLQKR